MCVIAVKKKGIDMVADETIDDMWNTNSDGAGFMYALNKRVYIEKGFMELKSFKNALLGFKEKVKKSGKEVKDVPLIMHFRITTHGGTNPENTHPYPLSKKSEFLKALDCYTEMAVAHNGIIRSVDNTASESDTAAYIRKILVPLFNMDKDFVKNKDIRTVIENTINGSRLAFLDLHGDVNLIGDFQEEKGVLYSNLLHNFTSLNSYGSRVFKSGSRYFPEEDDSYWESYASGFHGKLQRIYNEEDVMEEIYDNENDIEEDWWTFAYRVVNRIQSPDSVPNSKKKEELIPRSQIFESLLCEKTLRELPEGVCLTDLGGVNYDFTRIMPAGFRTSYVIKKEDVGNYFVDSLGDVYLRFVNDEETDGIKKGQEIFFESTEFDYALKKPVELSPKNEFMLTANSDYLSDCVLTQCMAYCK